MHAWQVLVAALIGGAAAVERKGALQLMLSRPLPLGALLGYALGDARGGLLVGLPLELLFLGAVNLGAALPDNETIATSCAATAAVLAGRLLGMRTVDAPLALMAIALFLPVAIIGRRLERISEGLNLLLARHAVEDIAGHERAVIRAHVRGLFAPFIVGALAAGLAAVLATALAFIRYDLDPRLARGLEAGWVCLLGVSGAAAVRAIRDPRAPYFAAAGAGAIALAVGLLKVLR